MLVILEGADGSGKTTLANRIRKEIDQYLLLLRSNGPPSIGQLADYIGWVSSLPHKLVLVTDRNPIISEAVYGPIIRGKCLHALTTEQIARQFRNAMIIHCRPNYSALAAGAAKEVQMDGVVMNLRHIIKAYDELMGKLESEGVYIKRYDFTGPPQLILDSIKAFIRKNND